MKSKSDYVRRGCVARVRKEITAYRRFKRLLDEWIDLSIEASKLRVRRDAKKTQGKGEFDTLKMDDFRLYDRALTEVQVAALNGMGK